MDSRVKRVTSEHILFTKCKIRMSNVSVHIGESYPNMPKAKTFLTHTGVRLFAVYNMDVGIEKGSFFFTNEMAKGYFNLETCSDEEYEELSKKEPGYNARTLEEMIDFILG